VILKKVNNFRVIAFIEGVSFLVLLFVAMPMKYMYGIPVATKIMGSLHGILFILFCVSLYTTAMNHRWMYRFRTLVFLSSLLPFGMVWLDKKLQNPESIPVKIK